MLTTVMASLTYQVGIFFITYTFIQIFAGCSDDKSGFDFILATASGDSSMEREFSGGLGGPTVSTPNSKETSPSRSLSGQCEE